ncbi:MAG: TldD/PmbA family protein [Zetaproteobacteria bacterium]|nr:TldD/PmbA family protein [Zetaproteobacteria bacterium]
MSASLEKITATLTQLAMQKGAVDADAITVSNISESISIRHGNTESLERSDSQGTGLRLFIRKTNGVAFASASTSDFSAEGLQRLVDQVWEMAQISEPDPDAVLPSGAAHPSDEEIAIWKKEHPEHDEPWQTTQARDAAIACEAAALHASDLISNSEGASAAFGISQIAYANAEGFHAEYQKTSVSLSCSVIAGSGDEMQRDYSYRRAHAAEDLPSAKMIGEEAAMRTVRRLHAQSMTGGNMPVVFEPRVATSILGHLISAINGRAILQKRSFLSDALNLPIFPDFITIEDHPNHPDGLGNRLFDGEGTRCKPLTIIDHGVLQAFLTDRYAAGRLNSTPTGHASRGLTGDTSIGTSNVILHPGEYSPEEIYQDIGNGLLVTELIGFGVNGVTGDYSRGAAGFLIENGALTKPVHEITIAGNLHEMFAGITHIGRDLTWFGSMATPTIAFANLAVAGDDK